MKCLSAIALVILGGLLQLASVKAEEPLQSVRYGTWGFDISGENAAIKPGDDFFEFANGGWLARTPIPADKIGMSIDVLIDDLTDVQLRKIMEEAAHRADHEPKDLKGKVGARCCSTLVSSIEIIRARQGSARATGRAVSKKWPLR